MKNFVIFFLLGSLRKVAIRSILLFFVRPFDSIYNIKDIGLDAYWNPFIIAYVHIRSTNKINFSREYWNSVPYFNPRITSFYSPNFFSCEKRTSFRVVLPLLFNTFNPPCVYYVFVDQIVFMFQNSTSGVSRQASQTSLLEQFAAQAKELVKETTRQSSQEGLLAHMDKVIPLNII